MQLAHEQLLNYVSKKLYELKKLIFLQFPQNCYPILFGKI